MKIRVKIRQDNIGNIIGYPVRRDIREKIIDHLSDFNVRSNGDFFFQEDHEAESLSGLISDRLKKDLLNGWDIYPVIDAWTAAHFYGWDTHTLFE